MNLPHEISNYINKKGLEIKDITYRSYNDSSDHVKITLLPHQGEIRVKVSPDKTFAHYYPSGKGQHEFPEISWNWQGVRELKVAFDKECPRYLNVPFPTPFTPHFEEEYMKLSGIFFEINNAQSETIVSSKGFQSGIKTTYSDGSYVIATRYSREVVGEIANEIEEFEKGKAKRCY